MSKKKKVAILVAIMIIVIAVDFQLMLSPLMRNEALSYELPIPPDARRVRQGDYAISFLTPSTPAEIERFYTAVLEDDGWQRQDAKSTLFIQRINDLEHNELEVRTYHYLVFSYVVVAEWTIINSH